MLDLGKTLSLSSGLTSNPIAGAVGPATVTALLNEQDVVISGITYRVHSDSDPISVTRHSRPVQTSFSFLARKGHRPDWDSASVDRTELAQMDNRPAYDTDIWQEWSYRVRDTNSTAPWFVIGQWHGTPNDGRSPWFALEWMAGGGIKVMRRTASAPGGGVTEVTAYSDASVAAGVWHQVVLHQVAGSSGRIELWHDATKIVDYTGQVSYLGEVNAGYFKLGTYRSSSTEDVRVDYVPGPIGTTSLASRIGRAGAAFPINIPTDPTFGIPAGYTRTYLNGDPVTRMGQAVFDNGRNLYLLKVSS